MCNVVHISSVIPNSHGLLVFGLDLHSLASPRRSSTMTTMRYRLMTHRLMMTMTLQLSCLDSVSKRRAVVGKAAAATAAVIAMMGMVR